MVDEELADMVWAMRNQDLMDDDLAMIAWLLVATSSEEQRCRRG